MNRTKKGHRASEYLEAALSDYENQIDNLSKEVRDLKAKLSETRQTVVEVAQEFGMSRNDNRFSNAILSLKKNLSQHESAKNTAHELGYDSIDNLFKAVKMMSPETKTRKTQAYYETHLPEILIAWPLSLQLTGRAGEDKAIRRYLLDSVYPVFETYLDCPHTDNDRLFDFWGEVEDKEDLNSLRNWCLERIHGVKEKLPDDKVLLEDLAEDCINLASCFNEPIRKGLAEWTSKMKISVTRLEYNSFWEGYSYDRIAMKLLTKYAGCELNQYVREALKEEKYNCASLNGEWKESLTLEQLAASMQAVEAIKDAAEWDTDFLNAALEALESWGKGSEEGFTASTNNYNVGD